MFECCTNGSGQPVVESLVEPKADQAVGLEAVVAHIAEVEQPAPEPENPAKGGKSVHVLVVAAKGIRNADWMPGSGLSDAFVTVDVAGSSTGFKTAVIKDSLQPVWDHEGELMHVPDGADLDLTVWDQDAAGKNLLGRARLPASAYEANGFNGDLLLQEAGREAHLKVKVRVAGQDYPPGVGATYTVVLEKAPGVTLGVDVDVLDGTTLQICGIKPGVVQAFNQANASTPHLQLNTGVYIIDVNGTSCNASEMIVRMKEDNKLTLKIRRPQLFPVSISKKGGTLGLDLNYAATGIALLVLRINPGPVADWNATYKVHEIVRNDRIVSVNGVTGKTKDLYEAIKSNDNLQFIISRPAPDSWWGHQ